MDSSDNYPLRRVLQKEELSALAVRIKNDFPYCIQMYNTLLINSRGQSASFRYEFYVPKDYPDSHLIIWRTMVERQGMGIHCTEGELPLLTKVIRGRHFLSIFREIPVNFVFLSSYMAGPVLEMLQELLQVPLLNHIDSAYAYVTQQNSLLRCPAGMKIQRLTKAGVQKMLENNSYWKDTPLDIVCNLTEKLPALGIYPDLNVADEKVIDSKDLGFADPESAPIAWICTSPYGSVAMLRTESKYKRQGLASLLVELLGRLQIAEGYFPHAVVVAGNDASAAMFEKLDGWRKTHYVHWITLDQ